MSPAVTASRPPSILRGTIRPAPMVTHVVRGDESVLADIQRGRYYTLSAVGSRIWALLLEAPTFGVLIDRLLHEYEVPVDRLTADTVAFLTALREAKLIACEE